MGGDPLPELLIFCGNLGGKDVCRDATAASEPESESGLAPARDNPTPAGCRWNGSLIPEALPVYKLSAGEAGQQIYFCDSSVLDDCSVNYTPYGAPTQIYFCDSSVLDDHYVIGSRRGADSRLDAGNGTANGEVLAESPVVAQHVVAEIAGSTPRTVACGTGYTASDCGGGLQTVIVGCRRCAAIVSGSLWIFSAGHVCF